MAYVNLFLKKKGNKKGGEGVGFSLPFLPFQERDCQLEVQVVTLSFC